jgi:hypothetical protein
MRKHLFATALCLPNLIFGCSIFAYSIDTDPVGGLKRGRATLFDSSSHAIDCSMLSKQVDG